jgi:hypothetical protein
MEDGMDDRARPWLAGEAPASDGRRHAPATARNSDAIATLLAALLPRDGLVLEVASGSGEHVVHFARRFPALRFQPSDPDPAALASIAAWTAQAGLANVAPPIRLDAAAPESWPLAAADALLCINMVHISPWDATVGLFTTGAKLLQQGAPLILYGPYFREGHPTAPSNLAFDESLKARNGEWGIRKLEDVTELAERQGFTRSAVHEMPANNLTVVYFRS